MIPEFKPNADPINANQGTDGSSKDPANKNLEKITSDSSQKAASIGSGLSPASNPNATKMQTPAKRDTIPASTIADDGLKIGAQEIKESKPTNNISYSDFRKLDASAKLFEQKLSPGYEKLLTEMAKHPKQLEADLGRMTINIGNIPQAQGSSDDPEKIYKDLSEKLTKYIKSQNPNLKVDSNKIDEILYSTTQSAVLDLLALRQDRLPNIDFWYQPMGASSSQTGLNFEKTWFSKPDVLIVNKKIINEYDSFDDPDSHMTVIADARIKHNLKTKDVSYEYEITITTKGKNKPDYHEIWDPNRQ